MSNIDYATRYQPRLRAQTYLDRERNSMRHDDSGTESEHIAPHAGCREPQSLTCEPAESLPRRKFQRTAPEADTNDTFRKPSIPASAMRAVPDRRPSVTNARRRSTTMRENMRVPSGPREYPGGSPGRRFGSNNDSPPSVAETTNTNAAAATANRFLPPTTSDHPHMFGPTVNTLTRASFGNPSSSDEVSTPTTPAERTNGNFDFVPTVNFDDFQSRLATFDGPSSSLLGEFPMVGGGRVIPKEESASGMAKSTRAATAKQAGEDVGGGISRSQSFSRRFAGGATTKQTPAPGTAKDTTVPVQHTTSLRTRRQSTMPQTSTGVGQPMPTNPSRPPRKSVGPGMFTGILDGKGSVQNGPSTSAEATKSSLARSSSLSKARRTTMGPATSGGADLPRMSTLTATTASRQAKVKSLQPPPRDPDPNTPAGRSPGKSSLNRAHTPSSSGNKRQSMAAPGRASGLGARTISPTDARRLKRMSMMQAPPMPTNFAAPKGPPTPQEEAPASARFPDVPRLAQPSPSLIPRKTSTNLTPTSARASPEARAPFTHSLSSKSSYQSLISANASTSRLPTPKTRNLHSSSAQYGEGDEERVPPVPAIPKAYESPKEHDVPFFSQVNVNSRKSSFATVNPQNIDSSIVPSADSLSQSRSSFDAPATETPRKGVHKRTQTIGSPKEAQAPPQSLMKSRQQPEATGRRNNNLQPLRLPPLNLLPLSSSFGGRSASYPKPSEELEERTDYVAAHTPEPKRVPKTPSTPMTASKATFWRKQDEKQNAFRSSTSHHVLRDMMGFDESVTRFFEDSDTETESGVSIPKFNPQQHQNRSAITPFASGSLPKHSGEFAGLRGRPSLDNDGSGSFNLGAYENIKLQASRAQGAPQGPRPRTSGTVTSWKTANETPGPGTGENSPAAENVTTPQQLPQQQVPVTEQHKKEGSGLRRKLSMGWRRPSSKSADHPENKGSPQETQADLKPVLPKSSAPKLNIDMPPPKLPASATWSGEIPSLSSSARPSLDSIRRKSNAMSAFSAPTVESQERPAPHPASALPAVTMQPPPQPKNRALHSEQPQTVSTRSSSWGNFSFNNRASTARPSVAAPKAKSNLSASGISAIVKDKDDLAADEEMRRLSQKRRDVDTAARESEEIKRRAIARSPMSPEQVLRGRDCSLNIFERGEIIDYEKDGVYFTGTKSARKIIGTVSSSPVTNEKGGSEKAGNYGYDDERGDYNIVMGDHLAYRYEVVDLLGKGSFGQVVRCVDYKEGGVVAIKIIRNKKRFHQQALVEVGILGRLRDWDPTGAHATLSITSSFYFRSHLCIVTPCLSINLYELIRAHNFTGFTLPLIRRFSRQLLACLVLLQQKHIIHCDLKPENILLCEARKADVRVIDFGSSCREEEKVYTYIQSRFYRSPEVILGSSYGLGIDMWSFGCILAELWTGYPIFPGENEQEQLACIMEIFGPPDRHLVERCTRKKLFFDSVGKPRVTVSSKGRRRRPSSKTLQQALKTDDEAFIDFIARCLRWDPDRRLKPTDAINHPFITNQPLSQRPGIPEEARRAARVRSSNAVPTTSATIHAGSGFPSPVKRPAASQGNAFAQQPQQLPSVISATPRNRNPTEPPATALRVHPPQQQSPSKNSLSSGLSAGRRHSSIVSAGGASAIAGSKRASNGAVLGGAGVLAAQQLPQMQPPPRPSLAQMAARESMSNVHSTSQQNLNKGGWRA